MTVRPEPNVDALAGAICEALGLYRSILLSGEQESREAYAAFDSALLALSEIAALARANTHQEQLLHDAMDALAPLAGRPDPLTDKINALLARFRALTGTDT